MFSYIFFQAVHFSLCHKAPLCLKVFVWTVVPSLLWIFAAPSVLFLLTVLSLFSSVSLLNLWLLHIISWLINFIWDKDNIICIVARQKFFQNFYLKLHSQLSKLSVKTRTVKTVYSVNNPLYFFFLLARLVVRMTPQQLGYKYSLSIQLWTHRR